MREVVVYLSLDYTKSESIFVDKILTKEEITEVVDNIYDQWFYYDIIDDDKEREENVN